MFDFNDIVKKYNYDEEISEFLNKVYVELVKYYGNEDIIYNAFLNTEIISTSNIYEYLKENDMLENDTLVTENDLRRSSGIYTSKPIIKKINERYEIVDIKRVVLVKDFDIKSTNKKAVLIHELCHMVKSYENEYRVIANLLENNSGLIQRYYKLSFNEEVEKDLIRERGVGLEEGFTSISEEHITRNIVDKDYKQTGYGTVYSLAKKLIDYVNESLIKYSEIHHDKDILYDKLISYDEIEHLADLAYKLNLEMYAKAFDEEGLEEIKKIIINLMDEYRETLNKKEGKTK